MWLHWINLFLKMNMFSYKLTTNSMVIITVFINDSYNSTIKTSLYYYKTIPNIENGLYWCPSIIVIFRLTFVLLYL